MYKAKNLLITLGLLTVSTAFSLTTKPDLDLKLIQAVKTSKAHSADYIHKSAKVLKESKMEMPFSLALKEVLKNRMQNRQRFDRVLKQLDRRPRLVQKENLSKDLLQYAKVLESQSKYFWELTQAAQADDINKFNEVCQVMIDQFDRLEEMEMKFQVAGVPVTPQPLPFVPNSAVVDTTPVSK